MVAELKASNKYRDMDDAFGIVPMLDIIRQTRYNDVGVPFGVADVIRPVFRDTITTKNTDLVSAVEKKRKSIENMLADAMESLNSVE